MEILVGSASGRKITHFPAPKYSGTLRFTVFSQFIHLICCTKPAYKNDAHTRA